MKPFIPFAKRPFNEYFRDIFTEIEVPFTEIQTENTHLFYVTAPNGTYWLSSKVDSIDKMAFCFPFGSLNARALSDDKYTLEKILKSLSIKTTHSILHTKKTCLNISSLTFPVFSKPIDGRLSEECYKSNTKRELEENIQKTFDGKYETILLQEYINKPEFRVVTVGTKIIYAYRKGKPELLGDGVSTIGDLVNGFNDNLFGARLQDEVLEGVDMKRVLNKGERMTLADITAFRHGGTVLEIYDPEDIPQCTHDFFRDVIEKLGVGFELIGFDIFGSDISNMEEIIEVNTNPGNFGLPDRWVYNIYKEIFGI